MEHNDFAASVRTVHGRYVEVIIVAMTGLDDEDRAASEVHLADSSARLGAGLRDLSFCPTVSLPWPLNFSFQKDSADATPQAILQIFVRIRIHRPYVFPCH